MRNSSIHSRPVMLRAPKAWNNRSANIRNRWYGRVLQITCLLALSTILAAVIPKQKLPLWPDTHDYWRALVNVNQFIDSRPSDWFDRDRIITDLSVIQVKHGDMQAAQDQFRSLKAKWEARGIIVGTYVSGRTAARAADIVQYPQSDVTIEEMPSTTKYVGTWPDEPQRRILDLSDVPTRRALQAKVKALWDSEPSQLRFVDNAAVHSSARVEQPWAAYCDNMRELRAIAHAEGARVIFNVAAHIGKLSDTEMQQLMTAVGTDGIALEMPFHPQIAANPQDTEAARRAYRRLLDSGMAVILIPVDGRDQVLATWVRTWRKPSDHLYISEPFWKPPDMHVVSSGSLPPLHASTPGD